MDKALEDMEEEKARYTQEKQRALEERVPPLDLEGLSRGQHENCSFLFYYQPYDTSWFGNIFGIYSDLISVLSGTKSVFSNSRA